MKILYVHERFGALAGAEANAHITAAALGLRGQPMGILHAPATAKNEAAWNRSFRERFPLHRKSNASVARNAVRDSRPDVMYVHKMADVMRITGIEAEAGCVSAGWQAVRVHRRSVR